MRSPYRVRLYTCPLVDRKISRPSFCLMCCPSRRMRTNGSFGSTRYETGFYGLRGFLRWLRSCRSFTRSALQIPFIFTKALCLALMVSAHSSDIQAPQNFRLLILLFNSRHTCRFFSFSARLDKIELIAFMHAEFMPRTNATPLISNGAAKIRLFRDFYNLISYRFGIRIL